MSHKTDENVSLNNLCNWLPSEEELGIQCMFLMANVSVECACSMSLHCSVRVLALRPGAGRSVAAVFI